MLKNQSRAPAGWFLSSVLLMASGCSSFHEGIGMSEEGFTSSKSPVVEAFIEYAGPAERWAGPDPLLVELNAREAHDGYSLVSLPKFRKRAEGIEGQAREPAALPQDAPVASSLAAVDGTHRKRWETPALRQGLAHLAEAVLQEKSPHAGGCLYPIRVRLVRADGEVLERNGCRSSRGWARVASRLTGESL